MLVRSLMCCSYRCNAVQSAILSQVQPHENNADNETGRPLAHMKFKQRPVATLALPSTLNSASTSSNSGAGRTVSTVLTSHA